MKKRFLVGFGIGIAIFVGLIAFALFQVDYKGAKAIVDDYESGGNVVGKSAIVTVDEVTVNNYISGFTADNQAFVYSGDASEAPKLDKGDKILIKVTHITPMFNSYVIGFKEDK